MLYVVTAMYREAQMTDLLLRGLGKETLDFRVVLVDNTGPATDERHVEWVQQIRVPATQIFHNERNLGAAAAWNLGIRFALAQGADPILVVGNDTCPMPGAIPRMLTLLNEGLLFVTGTAVPYDTPVATCPPVSPQDELIAAPDYSFFMFRPAVVNWLGTYDAELEINRRRVAEQKGLTNVGVLQSPWTWGLFDEAYWPCLAPQTRVLRDDLSWCPIADLRVGDGVVGVDEQPIQPGVSRSYRRATVEAVRALRAPAVRITFDNDKEVVCTPNHRWLVKRAVGSGSPWHWRTTETLQPGYRICAPLEPWAPRDSYDGGWFAGLLDGEGCLRTKRGKNMSGVSFSQKQGVVLDRALELLAQWGVPFTMHARKDNGVVNVDICHKSASMALLGSVRPVRLLVPRAWEHMRVRSKGQHAFTVTSVEPVGERDVIDLCTTTGTYIAEGLVSHNSYFEDNDHHYRAACAGIPCLRDPRALWRHDTSHTVHHTDMGKVVTEGGAFQRNAERFRAKWGGAPHEVRTPDGGYIQSARPANVTDAQWVAMTGGRSVIEVSREEALTQAQRVYAQHGIAA